jgi:hypothetical protein
MIFHSFIYPLVKRLLARCLGRNVVAGKRTTNSEKRTERKSIKMMKLGRPPDATDRENQPAATDTEREYVREVGFQFMK